MKKIGIIGDSIAQGWIDDKKNGWVNRLNELLEEKQPNSYYFENRACAGDNVADAYNRLLVNPLSDNYDTIILSLGTNDIRRRQNNAYQLDFSDDASLFYWQKIIEEVKKHTARILITDLLPVIENRYHNKATLYRKNSDVIHYNQLLKTFAQEENLLFFERFLLWEKRDLESLYADAIHPNSLGHQLIAQELFEQNIIRF